MPPEQKSNGALLGAIVIIVILIIGGIYFWKTSVKNRVQMQNSEVSGSTANMEADLNSVDIDNLDSGI